LNRFSVCAGSNSGAAVEINHARGVKKYQLCPRSLLLSNKELTNEHARQYPRCQSEATIRPAFRVRHITFFSVALAFFWSFCFAVSLMPVVCASCALPDPGYGNNLNKPASGFRELI